MFNEEAFSDFQNEVAVMSKVRHRNVVLLHGVMLNPLRLVMEYCSHGDLLSALAARHIWNGPVDEGNAAAAIPPPVLENHR
jgi:serine/threonine protein kinase